MHSLVILLGSNQGNSKALIISAKQLLQAKLGKCTKASSIYKSEAWGFQSETAFLNQVLVFETLENPHKVLEIALEIEKELGRIRKTDAYTSRTMDIDLLFYDDLIVEEANLQLPHPRLHLRRFTLAPLTEVLPDHIHPKLKKTLRELFESCKDTLNVIKLEN